MATVTLKILICPLLFASCIIASTQNEANQQKKPNDQVNAATIRKTAENWIAYSRPSLSFPVTLSQSASVAAEPPTSAPVRYISKRISKKKPTKNKGKSFPNDSADSRYSNRPKRYRPRYKYHDLVPGPEDYERYYQSSRRRDSYPVKFSTNSPHSYYPFSSSVTPTVNSVYADSPQIARYVIQDPSKYFIQRIQPGDYYVKPSNSEGNVYTSASQTRRRLDSLDYDDFANGSEGLSGTRSITGFGPQSSFPPRQIMTKIAQPGQSQPCHGPECHQHHKGLVRFYWRRVVYPNDERRRPGNRFPRVRRQRRRRLRDRVIAPSDQRDTYYGQEDEANGNDDAADDQEDDDEDEDEESTFQYSSWKPGRGYGLDLDEGHNYRDSEKRLYRDRRWSSRKV